MKGEQKLETLVEKVLFYGDTMPEKAALCFKDKTVSYGELCAKVKNIAADLTRKGIMRGDRVMLSAVSKPEYVAALLGIQYVGAVAVPIDKTAKNESITDIWEITDAKIFLADGKKCPESVKTSSLKNLYEQAECANTEGQNYQMPGESDLCELLFTSGTTGKPKGAMLSYRCIYANMLNTWKGIGMLSSDIILDPLPLNHSFGMRVLRSALYIGATVVLQNGFTFAKETENNIIQHKCTAMACVPAAIEPIANIYKDKTFEASSKYAAS